LIFKELFMRKFTAIFSMICLLIAVAAWSQVPVRVTDSQGNELVMAAKGVRVATPMAFVSDSESAVLTSTTYVQAIFCNNVDATTTYTVEIKDNQGSPKTYIPATAAGSLDAGVALFLMASPVGIPFNGGVRLVASAANKIQCQIVGVQ
jgi:hypothetical protein